MEGEIVVDRVSTGMQILPVSREEVERKVVVEWMIVYLVGRLQSCWVALVISILEDRILAWVYAHRMFEVITLILLCACETDTINPIATRTRVTVCPG